MRKILLAVLAIALIATPVFAKDYIKATDIQKVSLGDTFEQVTEKIGEPHQVLSKELTTNGKEQVIWLYEVVKPPASSTRFIPVPPFKQEQPDVQLANQQVYQQERANNPPYIIIFINGKVSKLQRQKIDPNTNQPIGVVVY